MKRRQVITAFGTLAVGTGVAMGTGAFTTTSAERSFTVSTAGDGAAALKISPGSGQTADTVVSNNTQDSDNVTALSFGSINQKARVSFDGILQITNNSGTGNSIDITELKFRAEDSNGNTVSGIFVYKTGTSDGSTDTDPILDDSNNGKTTIKNFGGNDGQKLTPGEWVEVGFLFDTRGNSGLESVTRIEIIARTSESN